MDISAALGAVIKLLDDVLDGWSASAVERDGGIDVPAGRVVEISAEPDAVSVARH